MRRHGGGQEPGNRPGEPAEYFELRCAVVEMFYETLRTENYTVGQAASRCLVEFRREILGGGRDALVVLSVILSRVGHHDPAALVRFAAETDDLLKLAQATDAWEGLCRSAKARIQEDVRFTQEKFRQQRFPG